MKARYSLDSLLTLQEVAQRLKVSVRTVRSWITKRSIPFTKLHRRVYVDARIVEGLLNQNAVPAFRGGSSPSSRPTGQGGDNQESENGTWDAIPNPS
ncbi:MAG: helix-turn-helix domain-containing protein [Planctomycetes bacterium]|nr:helix-turn-helix domain-containing protein [Planctomycetota bacterium]